MKVYFDTEFTGLHEGTTLISIGLVDEKGRTFYAEFIDYDKSQCDDWINENVISHLKFSGEPYGQNNGYDTEVCQTKEKVKEHLASWLSRYDEVQLVSDVCHYDMVLFIDLFGTAFDIPSNVNASCHDINQDIADYLQISEREAFDISREKLIMMAGARIKGDKHNSLYDAQVIKEIYEHLHR